MCEFVEIKRDVVGKNIRVEFQRDASLRATEVYIINEGARGEFGLKVICFDNGEMKIGGCLCSSNTGKELLVGVDIV